jgi:hypothetical protein
MVNSGREPGIHNPSAAAYGFRVRRFAASRNDIHYAWLAAVLPSAAWAAASRAIGTRNGEHDT